MFFPPSISKLTLFPTTTTRCIFMTILEQRSISSGKYRQFHYTSVYQTRKPRWIPIAKSKRFIVPEPVLWPEDEQQEFSRHMDNYQILMKSLVELQKGKDVEARTKHDIRIGTTEEEISGLILKNDLANSVVAKNREEALKEEWLIVENRILEIKAAKEKAELERQIETEKFLKSEFERLETAIPMDDLDSVINRALGEVIDYNYAIDSNGKIYEGRHNSDKPQAVQ